MNSACSRQTINSTDRATRIIPRLMLCLGLPAFSGAVLAQTSAVETPELEVVVVYGQKIERSLLDTAASVSLYDGGTLRDLNLIEMNDLYLLTPNVNIDDSGQGSFSIRGINFNGVGFAGVSNTAALYVDDIFQSNLGIEAGPLSTFDTEQVEIFRGPQSTLQGRNALAGAIMVRTSRPRYEWGASARVDVADYDTHRLAVAGGGPLIDDQLAFRIAIDFRETDGYIENTTLDRDDVDSDEAINVRTKLLWEPTDRLSTLFTYIYAEGNAGTGIATGAVEGPDFAAREITTTNVTLREIETQSAALNLGYELNARWRLEWVTTYTDADENTNPKFDEDPEISTGAEIGVDHEEIFTTDLRLRYQHGPWTLLGGAYYFDRDEDSDMDLSALLSLGPLATTLSLVEVRSTKVENYALYFDGEFAATEKLSVLFGARYDEESFSIDSQSSTLFDPEFPPVAVSNIGARLAADTTFDAFLPKLGLR